jgi:hypothetical protein
MPTTLHGVVGEHSAATAVTGASMAGDVMTVRGVRAAGDLIRADNVEFLAGFRVSAGVDRAVRHDDRGLIVLEEGGQRANRRLVAGNDGDGAGEPGGTEMLAERIVGNFTPDQRVAHFARAVADAVRRRDGVFRLDQAQLQLARAFADAALEAGVDRIDLRRNTHIALAVALGADHANRRLVDQIRIGAKFSRNPDGLRRASRMAVYDYDFRFCHGEFLSSERLVRSTICRVRPAEICRLIQAHEPEVLIGHPIRTSSPSTLRMQSHTERGCDHQHITAPRSRGGRA